MENNHCCTENTDGAKSGQGETQSAVETAVDAKSKPSHKKLFFGIGVFAAVVIAVVLILANARVQINLDEYLVIKTDGYDGYGRANASIDWDAIEEKYGKKLSFTKEAQSRYKMLLDLITPIDYMDDNTMIDLSSNKELSNGDEISYEWDFLEDLTKNVKCKLKYTDGVYKVEGLTAVGTFDAFEGLSVTFSGISPCGTAVLEYSGDKLDAQDFELNRDSGLQNGDIVLVKLNDKEEAYYVDKYGEVPSKLENEYTVSGLPEFITSSDDITDEYLNALKNEAEDTINSYAVNEYSKYSYLKNLTYAGYVFSVAKDDRETETYNDLYIIYCGNVSNTRDCFYPAKVFYPVRFSNNMIDMNGKLSYASNEGVRGLSEFDSKSREKWETKGYVNPYSCYLEVVKDNTSTYDIICGDGFDMYSKYEEITSFEDFDDADFEALKEKAQEYAESFAMGYSSWLAKEVPYVGAYLLAAKEQTDDFEKNNKLIIVFSVYSTELDETAYLPVEYDGIVKLPNGEFLVTKEKGIQGKTQYYPAPWLNMAGYEECHEDKMFANLVSVFRTEYTYEVLGDLTDFSK